MKLGLIKFANNYPVDWGHLSGMVPLPQATQIVKGTPSELNRKLARGEVDASAISAAEYLAHPDDFVLLPDLAIVSRGPVESVLLFSRKPIHTLAGATVSVTDQSATGATMLRVVLEEFLALRPRPQYERTATVLPDALRRYEAALLIGDDALKAGALGQGVEGHVFKLDLGKAWRDYTGTDMVYAVWAANAEFARTHPEDVRRLAASLRASRDWGVTHLREVSTAASRASGVPTEVLDRYLQLLSFKLDANAARGLLAFAEHAAKVGALPRDTPTTVREQLRALGVGGVA